MRLGKISHFMPVLGAALALGVGGAATSYAADNDAVVVSGPGGVYQDAQHNAMFVPAEKKLGIKIKESSGGELSTVRAQVRSGQVVYDLVSLGAQDCVIGSKEGLFEPLDYSVIDKSGFPAKYARKDWIGMIYYSTVITYNKKKYGDNPPKTWADFWNAKGYKSLRNLPQLMIEAALLADGVQPKDLYPLDLDRAFKNLDKIKPDIGVWWQSGAQTAQLIKTGDVDMIAMWNGRAAPVIKDGADYAFTYNQGLVTADCYAIPKGAPHKEQAMKLLAFMETPEVVAKIADYIPYGPVNSKAMAYIPENIRKDLNSAPDNLKVQITSDDDWWYEHGAQARERWDAFLTQ